MQVQLAKKRVGVKVVVILFFAVVVFSFLSFQNIEATNEKITIKFAARFESGNVQVNRDRVLEKFAQEHPNITVVREELPHADFWVKIPAEIAAGQGPDVISLPYFEQAVTFAAKGLLEPLDPFIDGSNGVDRKDFYSDIMQYGVYGGNVLVMPQAIMTTGLGYNKDMFNKAGVAFPTDDWTWDDMLAAAKKLTLDSKGRNAEDANFDPNSIVQWGIYTWWWNSDFDLYNWTFGGSWLSADGTKCVLDTPETLAAITFYGDLTQKYHVAPYLRELAPAHGHPALMDKKVAMAFVDIGNIQMVNGSGINWDMAVVPHQKGSDERAAFLYGEGVSIMKDSKNKEAAWELVKALVLSDWDPVLALEGYGFPPTRSVMSKLEFSPKVKVLQSMFEKGWGKAILATDYNGIVIETAKILIEGALRPGPYPDYKKLLEEASVQCNQALSEAPKLVR